MEETSTSGVSTTSATRSTTPPVVKLVNWVISRRSTTGRRTSTSSRRPTSWRWRFRIDGVLREITTVPRQLANGVASRIKIMADLDISERRVPQDGRVGTPSGQALDLRVATLPTVFGEKIDIRILDNPTSCWSSPTSGSSRIVLRPTSGLPASLRAVVITGPTGSGNPRASTAPSTSSTSRARTSSPSRTPSSTACRASHQVQVNVKARADVRGRLALHPAVRPRHRE